MATALRPMSTGEVLDRTFHLYRNHFLLFTGIATGNALCLLMGVLILIATGMVQLWGESVFRDVVPVLAAELVLTLFSLIGYALASGPTIYAVSKVHLGHAATVRESYRTARPLILRFLRIVVSVFLRIFGAFLLTVFLISFGVDLVIAPLTRSFASAPPEVLRWIIVGMVLGLFVGGMVWAMRIACRNSLAVPACMLEKLSARQALKRSNWLTKKSLGRISLVFLLTAVLGAALFYAFLVPGIQLADVLPKTVIIAWQALAAFAATMLSFPIATIAVSLLYYDLRVRKEAFDLQLMMEAVGDAPQAQVAATPVG